MTTQQTEKIPYATMKLSDARTFKQIVRLINQTADEPIIQITNEGLFINEMSANRCALIQLTMPKQAFDEWDVQTEGKATVSFEQLLKRPLRNVSKDEIVTLKFGWVKPMVEGLTVTLQSNIKRVFTQPLLETMEEDAPTPKVIYTTKAKLITKTVETILKDIEEYVKFQVVGDKLKILEGEPEYGDYKVELTKADELLELDTREDATAKYSKSYLEDFIKHVKPLADVLIFEYATDMPMHITAHLDNDVKVDYFLAPRIEVD